MSQWTAGELEAVACDLCGERKSRPVMRRPDGLMVCECPRCGLAFLNPRPRAERIARLYEDDYFSKSRADARGSETTVAGAIGYASYHDPAEAALRATVMRQRLAWVLSLLPEESPRRLLEVGCATGELVAEAHRLGVSVTGIDISTAAIRLAQQRYPGLDFRVSDAAGLAATGARFDAVIAFEVIEHVLSPREFLAACCQLLAPGGVLVYSTPNYRRARILKEGWIGYHMSFEHLYFLSDETLARLGEAAGLEMVEWKTTGTGTLPPPNAGLRGWCKQALQSAGLLPLIRRWKTYWRARSGGEAYDQFGSGHTLLMAFRKPVHGPAALASRAA
jgi:2-polyprenyl-3-methyl-5-hydroxy-6-metoxy-1,4-benzoquinol methylase